MEVATESMIDKIYFPNKNIEKNAYVSSFKEYSHMYQTSINDPETFWGDIAKQFHWNSFWKKDFCTYNFNVEKGEISIRWMDGASTNICYNALDRNVEKGYGDEIAFFWEGNDPGDTRKITYKELLQEVSKFANVLKLQGIKKGDRVAIYMPMIIELVVAMLACARIGAIHCIVFGGFSSDSLTERILDAKCTLLVTADGVWRGTKLVNLKNIVDDAIEKCKDKGHNLIANIVVCHLSPPSEINGCNTKVCQPAKRPTYDLEITWNSEIDKWWHDEMSNVDEECNPEWMEAEDPLFILYTSGSTGKPKGVLHTTAGYMIYAATTLKYVFDYHRPDVYFCTADIGWITGHSYVVYGPLLNGATSVLFEGIPTHPDPGRYWDIVDKYGVSKFYTAPTAIRALMKFGENYVKRYKRETLRVLGTVGEPINPEAWVWYHKVIGNGQCSIVDTFWQTETGGHVLTPLPGCTPTKPGSATFPFFGVIPAIVDENGKEITGPGEGYLVFKRPWPGMMRTVFGDHKRFETTYFQKFPGYYCTGDGARRDVDGFFWITGRIDDMLNVSGHLLSTAEVESALIEHKAVAESAVVSHPHPVKGECLYCFVVLKEGQKFTNELIKDLILKVRTKIGAFAAPEYIHHARGLPKTRSGKIMRRILRKIARNDRDLGDTSTLANENIVNELFDTRPANA
ncbi:acetyl-coenzyme A synthetase, cytoplasmic [Centruroides vittatus]|uniref:acetyl-coenzyme A synthetase, cytoplasmic n=1 Tax=Centruroides vittatus TaxID=120091 RepID=UPI00350F05C9